MSRLGSYTAVDSGLVELEHILGSVDNDHLGSALTAFFGAWSELANPPADASGLKQAVLSKAESLVADLHNINESLDELEHNIEIEIQQEIETLNSLLTQIGDLNGQIMAGEIGGQTANDLRDQRDLLVSQVSGIAEVTIHERDDGSMDLILNGRTMITRQTVQQFTTRYEQSANGYRITVVTQDNLRQVDLPDGHLKGLLESRDTYVTNTRNQLNDVVKLLVNSVNTLHTQARTSGGAGLPFFVGDSLHSIDVSEAIRDNTDLIGTSRSGEPGDNDIAREIGDLANFAMPGETRTVGDLYRASLIDLASQRGSFEFLVENQTSAVGAVEAKIASARGREPRRGRRQHVAVPEQLRRGRQGDHHGSGVVRRAPEHDLGQGSCRCRSGSARTTWGRSWWAISTARWARMLQLQRQAGSMRRINTFADDPRGVGNIQRYSALIASNDQYLRNLSRSQVLVDSSDTALQDISSLLGDVRELALRESSALATDVVPAERRRRGRQPRQPPARRPEHHRRGQLHLQRFQDDHAALRPQRQYGGVPGRRRRHPRPERSEGHAAGHASRLGLHGLAERRPCRHGRPRAAPVRDDGAGPPQSRPGLGARQHRDPGRQQRHLPGRSQQARRRSTT